jgi:hypothetical protein
MHNIASKGHVLSHVKLTPKDCHSVTEYLVDQSKHLGVRPDVRMLVDKAFMDFGQWKCGDTETHWQDLIRSTLKDRLVELQHPTTSATHVPSKKEEEAEELKLLEDIAKKYSTPQERLEAFVKATGKSLRTCQRRMRLLKAIGKRGANPERSTDTLSFCRFGTDVAATKRQNGKTPHRQRLVIGGEQAGSARGTLDHARSLGQGM